MAPGYNYQPVMIRTLVQNGGRATEKEIIEELKVVYFHFGPWKKTKYPFEILTKHNVCKYNESDKTYELLDFDSYSIAEKAWIIVECFLKDKTKKEILEKNVEDVRRRIKNEPKLTEDRDEVLDRYGKMFALDNIKNITKDDFLGFFRYENNHHWKSVDQPPGHLKCRVYKNHSKFFLTKIKPFLKELNSLGEIRAAVILFLILEMHFTRQYFSFDLICSML